MSKRKNIIEVDLSGCKNMKECAQAIELIASGKIKITIKKLTMSKDKAKDQLIQLLFTQVVDLSMMSKIELGDDVIAEINRLKKIINE